MGRYVVGGKHRLLTIQVAEFVPLHLLFRWGKIFRRHSKSRASWAAASVTSLILFLLFKQFYVRVNGPTDSDSNYHGGGGGGGGWVPPHTCQDCYLPHPIDHSLLQPHLLLILIHATALDRERRDAIRQTWVADFRGLPHPPPVQYRFVVGGEGLLLDVLAPLLLEAEATGDMIILDEVPDSATSLTSRTLDGFSLALQQFAFHYLLKCDDDTFADLPRLASELQRRSSHHRLYWGFMMGSNTVHHYGRYAEQRWSLCDRYLPYAVGGGYVLSRDLVQLLADQRSHLTRYSCEDVAVGAWLAPYNIERRHDTRFNTEALSRGCRSVHLVAHKISSGDMYRLYGSLQQEGAVCSWMTQWEAHAGFIYNWTAPNHLCCHRRYGVP